MAYKIFSEPNFWLELLLVYCCTFSLRYLERAARWLFYPNDNMILVRRSRYSGVLSGVLSAHAWVPHASEEQPPHSCTGHHCMPLLHARFCMACSGRGKPLCRVL